MNNREKAREADVLGIMDRVDDDFGLCTRCGTEACAILIS